MEEALKIKNSTATAGCFFILFCFSQTVPLLLTGRKSKNEGIWYTKDMDIKPDSNYVYHGSHELFETVIPRRQQRTMRGKLIFDEISFHATPYKWLALSYTSNGEVTHELNGKKIKYMAGVSLYKHKLEIGILGFESLENSLKKLYGGGGYVYVFDKNQFHYQEGLGSLEVITKESIKPIRVERIDDPVSELKKIGIQFVYFDLADPKNENWRHYL